MEERYNAVIDQHRNHIQSIHKTVKDINGDLKAHWFCTMLMTGFIALMIVI
jgi:hypothetical protein